MIKCFVCLLPCRRNGGGREGAMQPLKLATCQIPSRTVPRRLAIVGRVLFMLAARHIRHESRTHLAGFGNRLTWLWNSRSVGSCFQICLSGFFLLCIGKCIKSALLVVVDHFLQVSVSSPKRQKVGWPAAHSSLGSIGAQDEMRACRLQCCTKGRLGYSLSCRCGYLIQILSFRLGPIITEFERRACRAKCTG